MKRVSLLGWLTVSLLGVAGCTETTSPVSAPRSKPVVYTVNYPLQYFAERIAGEHLEIYFPAPLDEDPAYWKPDAATIAEYQRADVILRNGAGYAKWTETASLPNSRSVFTANAFEDRFIPLADELTHTHGDGDHSHKGFAFTTWLDPTLAIEQARTIQKAFASRWSDHGADFAKGFVELEAELVALDGDLRAILDTKAPLIASHPVYQYFDRRYDLTLESVHWEPDAFPTAEQWEAFATLLAMHPARIMIWEGEPLEKTVAELAKRGVSSVVFAPCGACPESGDYLDVMRANRDALKTALGR